jgi:hypothetical protein
MTEAPSPIARCEVPPAGLVTGYDGGAGVEAKSAVNRNDRSHTTSSIFVVTDTAEPRHPRHEKGREKWEGPSNGTQQAVTEFVTRVACQTRNFVTARHLAGKNFPKSHPPYARARETPHGNGVGRHLGGSLLGRTGQFGRTWTEPPLDERSVRPPPNALRRASGAP